MHIQLLISQAGPLYPELHLHTSGDIQVPFLQSVQIGRHLSPLTFCP